MTGFYCREGKERKQSRGRPGRGLNLALMASGGHQQRPEALARGNGPGWLENVSRFDPVNIR